MNSVCSLRRPHSRSARSGSRRRRRSAPAVSLREHHICQVSARRRRLPLDANVPWPRTTFVSPHVTHAYTERLYHHM
eukprot:3905561-Prymnesium_polylepis.1